MSRRPLQGPGGGLQKAVGRMAPGGLLWSEAPVLPWLPGIAEGGEVPDAPCINTDQFAWSGNWTSGITNPPQYSYWVYDYDYPEVPDPPLCCGMPPYGWNPPPPPPAGSTVVLTIVVESQYPLQFTAASFNLCCKPGHSQVVSGGPWAVGDTITTTIPSDWEFLRFDDAGYGEEPLSPEGDMTICPGPVIE